MPEGSDFMRNEDGKFSYFRDDVLVMNDSPWSNDHTHLQSSYEISLLRQAQAMHNSANYVTGAGPSFHPSTSFKPLPKIQTSTSDLQTIAATFSASSFGSVDTGNRPHTPQSVSLAMAFQPEHGHKRCGSLDQTFGDQLDHFTPYHSDTTIQYGYFDNPFGTDYTLPPPRPVALRADFDFLAPASTPYSNIANAQMQIHTPRMNSTGIDAHQTLMLQPQVASPAQISVASTPHLPTTSSTLNEPFLSPYNTQTPLQTPNEHNGRYSNPSQNLSPSYSYCASRTPSSSYLYTPQMSAGSLSTPCSTLTSPDDSSPRMPRSFDQHKSPQSPIDRFRYSPYSFDRAQRQRWSRRHAMTLPSRRKPRFGHSMSESHVPQMSFFPSFSPPVPGTNNIATLTNERPRRLAPAPDLVPKSGQPVNGFGSCISYPQSLPPERFAAPAEARTFSLWATNPITSPAAPTVFKTRTCPPEASSPPPEDMNPSDAKYTPVHVHPKFEGDIYTPTWKRKGVKGQDEGWCGHCGRWLNIKNSRYWEDKRTNHGISAVTRRAITSPIATRGEEGKGVGKEGLCGQCGEWVIMDSKRKTMYGWWKHASNEGHRETPHSRPFKTEYGGPEGLGIKQEGEDDTISDVERCMTLPPTPFPEHQRSGDKYSNRVFGLENLADDL